MNKTELDVAYLYGLLTRGLVGKIEVDNDCFIVSSKLPDDYWDWTNEKQTEWDDENSEPIYIGGNPDEEFAILLRFIFPEVSIVPV